MHIQTAYMEYSECLPTILNPLAERTCFSQVRKVQAIKLAEEQRKDEELRARLEARERKTREQQMQFQGEVDAIAAARAHKVINRHNDAANRADRQQHSLSQARHEAAEARWHVSCGPSIEPSRKKNP